MTEFNSIDYHKNWLGHNIKKKMRYLGKRSRGDKFIDIAEFWYECECGFKTIAQQIGKEVEFLDIKKEN